MQHILIQIGFKKCGYIYFLFSFCYIAFTDIAVQIHRTMPILWQGVQRINFQSEP